MMTRGRWLAVAGAFIAVALLLLVVRLVSGAGHRAAHVPPPSHDPPRTFAAPGVALPQRADADPLPIVLQGFDAVIALPDLLEVVDTRTGEVHATVPALDPATSASSRPAAGATPSPAVEVTGTEAAAPLVLPVGGRPAVVACFEVSVAGHGTTLGHEAVEVLAVDPAGYAPVARVRIDLPVSLSGSGRLRSAQVAGEDGGLLIVVARRGADSTPATYAVDPLTGRLAWQAPQFEAAAVAGHRVAGVLSAGGTTGLGAGARVAALNAGDGRTAWTAAGPAARSASVWAAGPALVAASTTDAASGARTLQMLDAVTGTARDTRPAAGGVTCRYDERSVTVCAQAESGDAWAAGYDASTGRQLWQLPDAAAGRVAPQVSTVWHGVVYGGTANGPVALDARTGTDEPQPPGAVPALVNGYVGISAATLATPHPMAYRATS
jgi:hypothetical protein